MQALIVYWFIFWQSFLRNPYLLATSEIATTNFPHWIWMGRKWQATDNLYYKFPASIPFLSMWYLPSVLVSKLTRFMNLDNAFRLYVYFILIHYLLASFIAYEVLGLFGALTLTYAGYCIKPQTPSFVYTITWIPGILLGGWKGSLCFVLAILGGYWPILVYVAPVLLVLAPTSLFGIILALPQIIPFLKYWKKSVRSGEKIDRRIGSIPWWKLKDLFWPSKSVRLVNGVHYPEAEMYVGIAVLFIWQVSWWWIIAGCTLMVSIGLLPSIQRIPARSLYLLTFSLCFLVGQIDSIQLIALQAFLLLRNSSIYPSFPFSQWWNAPSRIYPESDYTGYLTNSKIHDYKGGFSLR